MKKKSPISLTTNFQRVVCYVIIGLALYLVVYTLNYPALDVWFLCNNLIQSSRMRHTLEENNEIMQL